MWQLQEITNRLPGRIDTGTTSFSSVERDLNWPAWYAAYMVAEQSGAELPT